MNGVIRNGLFQRLPLAALAIALALACAVLWNAARAPAASAQSASLATLESCRAEPISGDRIVEGERLKLVANVEVGGDDVVATAQRNALDNRRWKVHFTVERVRAILRDYRKTYRTTDKRIDYGGNSGTFEYAIDEAPNDGTYTLACVLIDVRDFRGDRDIASEEVDFTVHPASAQAAPADDHGDTRSSSTEISVGSSANGAIGTASDVDYFSFQAQRGREYTIETSIAADSGVDTVITLYDDGSRLGNDNDGGAGLASKIVWTAPSSAAYYVKVEGRSDTTGRYRLSVSESAPPPGKLQVTPIGGLTAYMNNAQQRNGRTGIIYTLTNRVPNGETIQWEAVSDKSWITVSSPNSGELAGGESVEVQATYDVTAMSSVRVGTHTATVTFTNKTNGDGDTTRTATFHRLNTNAPPIDFEPVETLRKQAVSVAYRAAGLEEAWRQMAHISRLGRLHPVDIAVIDSNLWRPPTGSSGSEGIVLSEFDWSRINVQHVGGSTDLQDNSHGYGVTSIIAAVNHPKNAAPDVKSFSGVVTSVPGLEYHIEFHPIGNFFTVTSDMLNTVSVFTEIADAAESSPDVVNMSFGKSCGLVDVLCLLGRGSVDDIKDAPDTIFVIAAGNDGEDAGETWPAKIDADNVITVAATDIFGNKRVFWNDDGASNYGPKIDIAAPGVIHALYPDDNAAYNTISGTSNAAPLVSGVVALLRAIDPDISPGDVKKLLRDTGNPITVCVADGDIALAQCLGETEEWIVMNAGAAVKELMRQQGIPLAPAYAPAPAAPAQPPVARLTAEGAGVPASAEAGRSFDFRLKLRNNGGDGARGGISVSFPTLAGGSKSSNGYSSQIADVRVVGYTSGTGNVSLYKSGDSLNHENGSTTRALHLLIESDDSTWRASTERIITLRVTPKRAGDLPIRIRGWICADGYSDCSRSPSSGSTSDQQGYKTYAAAVSVSAPADDHGDTRSSATRISAGSSANGVIGTASDKDYFRFQAQSGREYTIETSIASGSSLDTLVTLYRSNGSVLGVDADGGAGLASKIVWTAPSSAAHYVEVKGIDNTTGGYRLSVSSSAPAPVARLTAEGAGVPASAEAGRSFDFRLKLRNNGGDGARGGISVSFPTLAGGSKSSNGYSSQIADVQVVGYTSGTGNVSLYKSGDSLNHANGSTTRALHLLIESDDATWRASTERIITLRVTPKRAGELPIRIRGWICADGYSNCSRSPSSGSTSDQQGHRARVITVSVSAPAPPPPAPTAARNGPIAFSSKRDGNDEIYAMNADGSDVTRLTNNSANDWTPSWSPDGRRIAFESSRSGNPEIYAMNADGSDVTRLTNNSAADWHPSWSPDSRRIVFDSNRDGNSEIYAMNADGSGVTRLTNNSANDWHPSWSPDGRRIAFESNRDGNWEIYAMNADGSGVARLANRPNNDDYRPRWSPDGGKIAFHSYHGNGNWEIYTMNADGSGVTRLTNNSAHDSRPSWSPDGRRIAFDSNRSGSREIYAMNADGSGVTRLTNNSVADWSPSWGPSTARIGSGALQNAADDHGDTRSSATRISADSSANGVIGTASDKDYFRFQAQRGREYTIETSIASDSSLDTLVTLYRANGSALGVDADSGAGLASKIVWTAPSSAAYYVEVKGIDNTTGGYRLSVSSSAPADDHGDTRSSATRISAGSSANGVIGTASDKDYFSFQAQRGREYTIETSIASGSSLDTLVTLYRSNGSVLGVDADSGAGLTSKIVWTAPSSAAYYVEVKGIDNTTGGYRLSVSSSAPTQPPVARLSSPDGTSSLEVGRTIEYVVALVNDGGDGEHGGVSVSFPTLTGGSKSSSGYSSSLADVQVVRASGTRNVSLYKSGDSINHANGSTMRARHLLIESDDATWSSSTQRLFVLSVTPKRAGELRILVRGWICADGYSDCSRSPSSGSTSDQQGYRARVITLNAVAPSPQPPAPTAARNGPIVFSSNRDGNYEIYAMNADGSNKTRLTNNSDDDWRPSWSPDGRKIAFSCDRGGDHEICTMNADGSFLVFVTNNSADDTFPSWSPDSQRVVFSSNRSGNYEIYEVHPVTNIGARLANRPNNDDYYPRWSPDGGKIAFYSYYGDDNSEIVVMNADGSGVVRLTNNSTEDKQLSWSPDGRRIAFASDRDGDYEIYTMNADGSGVTRLTNNSADDNDPSWSPDGRRIAFASYRDGNYEIYAMNADGSGVTRLTNNSSYDGRPSWGPSTARVGSGAPQNAADDHGDSRSSATRISVGSSANGVIGTASDADYFSFQAQRGREYTIETSIPSSSDVDTFITLYRSNGSSLGENDDGGGGYASKIVWTAPSSATYYVKVDGLGDSTGGYRLSLSSRAPTQPPVARIEATEFTRSVEVGQPFEFYVELANVGGDGEHGGVSVSFPELTGGSKSSRGYSSSLADVQVVDYTSGTGNVSLYKSGDSLNHANGSRMSARHLLIESDDAAWRSSTERLLALVVTPKRAGELRVLVRGWICADGYSDCSRDPASGSASDQQGYRAMVRTFNVVAAAPADDHGDSRSSATRISSGSGANGVIGTANDADYFSFQAQRGREYTIETSIPSSSDVDTFIELYAANGSLLDDDDDGGDGYASKIEWTAPSSATYYVKVDSLGYSTGGYRLSVSSSAPAAPPSARFSAASVPDSATAGRSFDVSVELRNDGGDGERGGISVSFPTLTGGSKSSNSYSSSLADVQVVDYTSGRGNVSLYKSGDSLNHANGSRMSARHLLIESDDATWRASAERELTLRITPKRAGEFPIRIRGWICADGYSDCARAPSSGSTADQQGYRTFVDTVNVVAAAPADDHGDSRSSATRISSDSSANGVIGTASDADYFSFQAQRGREYTIETSIPSSSDVDTEITLYSSGGSRLGGNDDGGDGYASKIVWTAPSSATYYVKVDGLGDSTGGYRLSLSSRAPTPAPSPVITTQWTETVEVGQSFDFIINLANRGGGGERGGVSVSFPTLTGGSKSSNSYSSSAADVRVVSYTSGRGDVSIYKTGDSLNHANGSTIAARHLLIESDNSTWGASTRRSLTLRITPKRAGEFPVRIRGWICADGYSDCARAHPSSGSTTDQQGYRTYLDTVRVVAPAPAPAPVAEVRAISIPREATVGQSFEIRVELGNGGGAGDNGGFSISFPSLTGGSTSSGRYASSAADVQTVNASAWDSVSMYKSGDTISSVNGDIPAEHLLVEARDNSWSPSSDRALRLRVTPKRAGEFPIRVAAWICSAATACSLNPASGQQPTDQQGYSATVRNVTVRPAAPADDHGDSRSSATRVSAGASENGVIGTASDADYFSFRASSRLEYTIQTGIRSGSDVDTFITLYDANGSFVDEDDDGGNGFASKIVWTAPSSATYYVKVEGLGGSTGGYWLSVTERAQAPAPVPNVSRISVPNAATAGRSFDVTVELRNDGGDGERGGISVSFPTLTGGSKSSRDWSSSLADVRVVDYTGGTGNVSLYKSGDSINHSNGSRMSAGHLLIESDDSTWRSNTRRVLTLRVTPKRAGELPVKVRGWICADGYSDCSRAPTHGMDDQQGYDTAERTVLVVAPAPADDHGDDRSSATAMNANSRVSGRIETRGDEDYFSFRAQSGAEYTIETRAPSGLDTIITLYSAQGARLMQDDDDGAGRASKMEWTAPSSGTYYVKVYAHGGAVGAYELSLSETPPPVAGGPVSFRFNWSYSHSRIEVGESFEIEGRIHSVSGSGDRGGVSISFPSLTGGRSDVRRYRSSAADVNVVTSEGMSVFVYAEDEIIDTPGLPDVTARHLLFESDDIRWSSSTDRTLKLRVTPKRAGEIPILIRGWVCANRYLNCARYPSDGSNGSRDQQGQWAVRLNVTVVDPP